MLLQLFFYGENIHLLHHLLLFLGCDYVDIVVRGQGEQTVLETAEALKEKAHKEIEAERVKLYQEAKNKAAALSMILIEKSLKDYLDSESKKRITQAILTNLSLANSKNEN